MKKKSLGLAIRIILSLGLVGYFLWMLSQKHDGLGEAFGAFSEAFKSAEYGYLVMAFSLHFVGFILGSLRWKVLLAAQGSLSSLGRLFLFYVRAAFFNTFLPSTIGGDTVRVLDSRELTGKTTTSAIVVIIERITGLIALVLISLTGLMLKLSGKTGDVRVIYLFIGLALGGFLLAILLFHPKIAPVWINLLKKILPKKIQAIVDQAHEAIAVYYKHPVHFLGALGISLLFQLNMVLYIFLIGCGLNQNPGVVDYLMRVPVFMFLMMVVPAINGLGVRTAGFKELLRFPVANALAGEVIELGLRLIVGLTGGIVFLVTRPKSSKS